MVKNITLSADEELIKKARLKSQKEGTTLNSRFRQWLKQYVSYDFKAKDYDELMKTFGYAKPGKYFTRDERNER